MLLFCVCVCVQAVDRGLVFEVSYSAAIRDSTMRRYTIANAVSLMDTCKGKVRPFCQDVMSPVCTLAMTQLPLRYGMTFSVVILMSEEAEPTTPVVWLTCEGKSECLCVFQNVILSSAAEKVSDQFPPVDRLITMSWSLIIINVCVSSASGAQRPIWHHQPVSFYCGYC